MLFRRGRNQHDGGVEIVLLNHLPYHPYPDLYLGELYLHSKRCVVDPSCYGEDHQGFRLSKASCFRFLKFSQRFGCQRTISGCNGKIGKEIWVAASSGRSLLNQYTREVPKILKSLQTY